MSSATAEPDGREVELPEEAQALFERTNERHAGMRVRGTESHGVVRMPDTARLFWSGRSQAVRLPKEFRMKGDEVRIRKQGAAVVLELMSSGWEWLDSIAGEFSEDFFAGGREQPEPPSRPGFGDAFE